VLRSIPGSITSFRDGRKLIKLVVLFHSEEAMVEWDQTMEAVEETLEA
jgi:hypothetical protein